MRYRVASLLFAALFFCFAVPPSEAELIDITEYNSWVGPYWPTVTNGQYLVATKPNVASRINAGISVEINPAQPTIVSNGQLYALSSVQLSFKSRTNYIWDVSASDGWGYDSGTTAKFEAEYYVLLKNAGGYVQGWSTSDKWQGSVYRSGWYYVTHPYATAEPIMNSATRHVTFAFDSQWSGDSLQYFTQTGPVNFDLLNMNYVLMTYADGGDYWNKAKVYQNEWFGSFTLHYLYEPLNSVPEPATMLLLGLGLIGLAGVGRKFKN